jgi:hypothetical protein
VVRILGIGPKHGCFIIWPTLCHSKPRLTDARQ